MNPIESVWAPVFEAENSSQLNLLLRNAVRLSVWLHAPLHIVFSSNDSRKVGEWLNAVSMRTRDFRYQLHAVSGGVRRETLKLVYGLENALLLLGAERLGLFGPAQGLAQEKLHLLEQSRIPTWILPVGFRLDWPPVSSVLVAMSGEKRASMALEMALRIGNIYEVPVDILHVTSSRPRLERDRSSLGQFSDQIHHEYPGMVEELIAQGSPYASPLERLVIREFCHCYGSVARELKRRIRNRRDSLVIFEWKGSLERGRAQKVKLLLRHAQAPILLIREDRAVKSRLKIGNQFGVAR